MPSFLGMGLTDGDSIYVPIPKNGSSSHRVMFQNEGWEKLYFGSDAWDREAYVPVRHPVDRWLSGAYQRSRRPGRGTIEEMAQSVIDGAHPVLDENTMAQMDFMLSSLHHITLVKLEHAGDFVDERWGFTLPEVNVNSGPAEIPLKVTDKLFNVIMKNYQADFNLWRMAV